MILLIVDHGCEETDSAQLWGDWNCWADTWMDCTVFLPGNDDDDDDEEEEEENDNDIERIMGLGMVPKTFLRNPSGGTPNP